MSNTVEKPLENEGTEELESELKVLVQKGQNMIAEAVARHPSGYKGRLKIEDNSQVAEKENANIINKPLYNGTVEDATQDLQKLFQNMLNNFPDMKTITLGSDGFISISNIYSFITEYKGKVTEKIDSMCYIPFVMRYPDGGEATISLHFEELKEEIYMMHSDSEEEILSYRKLVKGTVNHEKGIILWDDGMETEIDSNEIKDNDTVVFAELKVSGKMEERNVIPERNIMVGEIDLSNLTIVFK